MPAPFALPAAPAPVRIRGIEIFPIEIPIPRAELEAGRYARYTWYEVETDAGIRGWAFDRGTEYRLLDSTIRPALVGQDLFAVERHLQAGLGKWGGLELAIWDAIGKVAGQPVCRLLGASPGRLKVYLTCVWKGPADQSRVRPSEQAEFAVRLRKAGYKGMKIRSWRANPLEDAEACGEIRAAVGPDFAIMVDRTAELNGVWDYATGLRMARALEKHSVLWLEEPFARADLASHARLAREVDIAISGGERYFGLEPYRKALEVDAFDLIQPDVVLSGGLLTLKKISALAEAFGKPVTLHGSMALRLAAWLHATAAIGAEWQELAIITPPLMPEEQWSPALRLLRSQPLFTLRDGYIEVPSSPGLGLDVDREAVRRCRVPAARPFYPQYPA